MSSIKTLIIDFLKEEEGLSVVEYIVGGAVLVGALVGSGAWNGLSGAVEGVISEAASGGSGGSGV